MLSWNLIVQWIWWCFYFFVFFIQGNAIDKLGTNTNPWQITASILSGTGNAAGQLTGTTTVQYQNGWANFTDLAISHFGDNYVLNFTVTYPAGVNLVTLTNFSLPRRPLKVNAMSIPTTVVANSSISLVIKLEDAVTSQIIEQTHWRVCTCIYLILILIYFRITNELCFLFWCILLMMLRMVEKILKFQTRQKE